MRHAVVLLLLLAAGHAAAVGGRMDFYGTNISDDSASLTLERRSLFGGSTVEAADFDAGMRPEFGTRLMLHSDSLPLVGGVDLSVLHTGSPQLNLTVTHVAVVGGLRLPAPLLARRGHGWHPYVLAGISRTGYDGSAEVGSIRTDIRAGSMLMAGGDFSTSPFLAAGLEWHLTERFGLVMEYRRRTFDLDSISTNSFIFPTENILASGRINASGMSLGVSWLFNAAGGVPAKMPGPTAEPAAP